VKSRAADDVGLGVEAAGGTCRSSTCGAPGPVGAAVPLDGFVGARHGRSVIIIDLHTTVGRNDPRPEPKSIQILVVRWSA
jgi:hypothetical protein